MNTRERYLFTSLMHTTGAAAMQRKDGSLFYLYLEPNEGQPSLKKFMCKTFPGFKDEWFTFLLPCDSRPRPHIMLERADDNDSEMVKLLLSGKYSPDASSDNILQAFLNYYVLHAQINWKHICNAMGCTQYADKKCSKCKTAVYCSRECQVSDWRMSHKHSCIMLRAD